MGKYIKTRENLIAELKDQLAALRLSCTSYDKGNRWEAKRLATAIHILLHDRGRTKSLSRQLGLKAKLRIPSAVQPMRKSSDGGMISPLIVICLTQENGKRAAFFSPIKGETSDYKALQFNDWWEENIFEQTYGRNTSRKNVVFSLRDQDGGSHVDSHLTDKEYFGLKYDGDPNFCFNSETGELSGPAFEVATGKKIILPSQPGEKPIPDAPFAIVRQIAWEVDKSFELIGY